MTLKQCALGVICVAVVCNLLGDSGTLAQEKADNTPRFDVKFVCPKHEIVAGENLGFQVVISNLSQRIRVAPPQSFMFLRLKAEGTNVPPQVKVSLSPLADIEIEANSAMTIDEDLCSWFPFGLRAGEVTLSMAYIPDRNNLKFAIMSNTVKITVKPRTPEQEKQYKDFVKIFSASGQEAIQKAIQFLATYPNSMFEARALLELGALYLTIGDNDSVIKVLEKISSLPSATTFEKQRKRYFSAQAIKAQGRLADAIAEAEKAPPMRITNDLQRWKIQHKMQETRGQALTNNSVAPQPSTNSLTK